jgi:hypothetical protein
MRNTAIKQDDDDDDDANDNRKRLFGKIRQ